MTSKKMVLALLLVAVAAFTLGLLAGPSQQGSLSLVSQLHAQSGLPCDPTLQTCDCSDPNVGCALPDPLIITQDPKTKVITIYKSTDVGVLTATKTAGAGAKCGLNTCSVFQSNDLSDAIRKVTNILYRGL